MDALLSETKDDGRPLAYDKVAGVVVTGNEDGAHHVIAEIAGALIDIGYTIPGQAWTYWNKGPGPGEEEYLTTSEREWSDTTGRTAAQNPPRRVDRARRPGPAGAARVVPRQDQKGATMPPAGVKKGTKRARQYEHIKESQKDQGASESRAEEIAARTVNKERARSGESRQRSRTSTNDMSSSRRGGQRSGTNRQKGRTRDQLYNEAKNLGIEGRSSMNKAQLQRAIAGKKS